MIDQTIWLSPRATSYTVVCEECAAEHGYLGAQVEGRLELDARAHRHHCVRGSRDPRRAREPGAYRRAHRLDRARLSSCLPPSSSVRSGATKARARSSICSRSESDVVCRYQGGPNAGHTVIVDGETFKFRHLPSGILSGKVSVLGAGCVVDPAVLLERDRRSRGARDLGRAAQDLGQRAPDHAVAHRHRRREREAARQAPDRDDAAWDRARVRRQGGAARDSRPGPARPEDPAPEDRDGTRREERLARARLRARAVRARGRRLALRGLRAAAAAVRRRHVAARRRRDPRRPERPARGRAGDAARPRPRHVSVRHVVEPDRRRGRDRDRDRADADRPGDRRLEGVRHAGRRRAVPERDGRPSWRRRCASSARSSARSPAATVGRAGSISSRSATRSA